jgi:hypothetical protein
MSSKLFQTTATNLAQPLLVIPEVSLAVRGGPVCAPCNIVYSTAPFSALDSAGKSYFVKGEDDPRVVLAEVLGHILAGMVKIPVPDYAVGKFTGTGAPVFASAVVDNVMRDVSIWIRRGKVKDLDTLPRIIALDVWLANNDRNMGNILGRSVDSEEVEIELVAIDFEKSAVVRSKYPLTEIPRIPPKAFWPRDELGKICRAHLKWNPNYLDLFQAVSDGQIEQAVSAGVAAVGGLDASEQDGLLHVLKRRRDNLKTLVSEVWN